MIFFCLVTIQSELYLEIISVYLLPSGKNIFNIFLWFPIQQYENVVMYYFINKYIPYYNETTMCYSRRPSNPYLPKTINLILILFSALSGLFTQHNSTMMSYFNYNNFKTYIIFIAFNRKPHSSFTFAYIFPYIIL